VIFLACMELLKISASVVATAIALVAYVPYVIDMFRGKNQPHLYTWISIFLITAVVAYIQVIGGAGVGAIPTILGAIINAVILFYCFKFGTKDIVFTDKVCLAVSILGVVFYIVFRDQAFLSLAILTAAEVISFIPTFRKTRNNPFSESLPSYYLLLIKLTLILVALEAYNLLTVSYSVLWIVVIVVFLVSTHYLRSKVARRRVPNKTNEAPLV
jgi:hypothetical protein